MSDSSMDAVERALDEIECLKKILRKKTRRQVSAADERLPIKGTVLAWFRTKRSLLEPRQLDLRTLDSLYKELLDFSEKHTSRKIYVSSLKRIKEELVIIRGELLTPTSVGSVASSDVAPDFAVLVSDADMQKILVRRWNETRRCISAEAYLAATVMMGGLLEALLLARIQKMPDKAPLFRGATAPKDSAGEPRSKLKDWKLQDFIRIAHRLGWITRSARDIGSVLRDYRNYIHPEKERSENPTFSQQEAEMQWSIFKAVTEEVLRS